MTRSQSKKPLTGWRILVPRGGEWGNGIAATLRRMGAVPVIAPMINFASTEDSGALTRALDSLESGGFDWLIVTSATTVDVLVSHGVHIPPDTKIAAIGETTGSALALAGYRVDFAPEKDNSARGFLKEWRPATTPARVLIPQSNVPDDVLVSGLRTAGVNAEFVSAYRTVGVPVDPSIVADVTSGAIGGILITSGSVAREIRVQLPTIPDGTIVAAIGPRTAFDAREAGIRVDAIAESRTADSLVDVFVEHVTAAHDAEAEPRVR